MSLPRPPHLRHEPQERPNGGAWAAGAGGWFEPFPHFIDHVREVSEEQTEPAVAQDSAR